MDKQQLQRRVLKDPRIDIYECGRKDVQLGQIDRRVLATLAFLSLSGFRPGVTSLTCGHGFYTSSGNVSHHSSGNAVDIATLNGIPVLGHQGTGSVTDLAIQRLLTLQGLMQPSQIISLMTFDGRRQHVRHGRPRRPHPRRLPAALQHQLARGQARQRDPQAAPVGRPRRPPLGDRQPVVSRTHPTRPWRID